MAGYTIFDFCVEKVAFWYYLHSGLSIGHRVLAKTFAKCMGNIMGVTMRNPTAFS